MGKRRAARFFLPLGVVAFADKQRPRCAVVDVADTNAGGVRPQHAERRIVTLAVGEMAAAVVRGMQSGVTRTCSAGT